MSRVYGRRHVSPCCPPDCGEAIGRARAGQGPLLSWNPSVPALRPRTSIAPRVRCKLSQHEAINRLRQREEYEQRVARRSVPRFRAAVSERHTHRRKSGRDLLRGVATENAGGRYVRTLNSPCLPNVESALDDTTSRKSPGKMRLSWHKCRMFARLR